MPLYVAAQLISIILVFDREVYQVSIVLVDIDETVLFQSHQRILDGEFDAVGPVEPPVAYALLPVERLLGGIQLDLPYGEGVRLDGIYIDAVIR